jgi:hypothetical protein
MNATQGKSIITTEDLENLEHRFNKKISKTVSFTFYLEYFIWIDFT